MFRLTGGRDAKTYHVSVVFTDRHSSYIVRLVPGRAPILTYRTSLKAMVTRKRAVESLQELQASFLLHDNKD